jgi:hypothetical protein
MDERGGSGPVRGFGIGDILMYAGCGVGLIVVLLGMVMYVKEYGFDLIAFSLLVLLGAGALAATATALSLRSDLWLWVPVLWCALVLILVVGRVSTIEGLVTIRTEQMMSRRFEPSDPPRVPVPAADFFLTVTAVVTAAGTYMAHKRIGTLARVIRPPIQGPEARLRELERLRAGGLISPEEHERKRKELVTGL